VFVVSGGLPGFCTLCGSAEDVCPCIETAGDHVESGYHPDAADAAGCDPCYVYGERFESAEGAHENGMHAGTYVPGCGHCECQGI
jgi:hypothetical protein